MSQENFAQQLGLNRGDIASYEQSTVPPIDALLKIANWYNISVDVLIKVDLQDSLTFDEYVATEVAVSIKAIQSRLPELVAFADSTAADLAKAIAITEKRATAILSQQSVIRLEELVALINTYTWVNAEWLIKGYGSMVNSTSTKLSKVAEPISESYATKDRSATIELFMKQVLERLEKLERKQ